jgi:hypothetical protein
MKVCCHRGSATNIPNSFQGPSAQLGSPVLLNTATPFRNHRFFTQTKNNDTAETTPCTPIIAAFQSPSFIAPIIPSATENTNDIRENIATMILPATVRCLKYKPRQNFGAALTSTGFCLRGIASRYSVEVEGRSL